jgi:thioredoxin reductase
LRIDLSMAELLHHSPHLAESGVYDVVIVGGGPAGLSAALVLGRARRRVLVCDAGQPRNRHSHGLHGYLTRDGTPPLEFLRLGREELQQYGIAPRSVTVHDVVRRPDGFDVLLEGDERVHTQVVLLASGVRDDVPQIPGVEACYGVSVHHCPYCDGWEHRDKTIAVLGETSSPAGLALSLKTWSNRIVAFTNGRVRLSAAQRRQLDEHGIALRQDRIASVAHDDGRLTGVVMARGETVACEAMFFTAPQRQQCDITKRIGCEFTRKGTVKTDHLGATCVPGIYVVGDASRDVQFVIVAAAEGAKAGVAINKALQQRDGLVAERAAS